MSARVAPPAAEQFRLPVPRQFRDYLIKRQNRRFAFALTLYAAVVLFFGLVAHWGWHIDVASLLFSLASFIAWGLSLKKPWHYVIDRNEMTVIWFEGGGRFWRWLPVQWKRIEITGVEEIEWRGLPALRLLQQVKNPKRRPDWLIVYAHEDAERVRMEGLPLIERYRRQYRSPVWADKLREQ